MSSYVDRHHFVNAPVTFLRPRLVGERFQGGAIPLEVLRDLAVIEEMFIEVAKWSYLRDHPDRKRAPRGFGSGATLKITEIDQGSAIPVISLFLASTGALSEQQQVYFEKARDRVLGAIYAAEHNERITDHLPESLLGYFNSLGRSLRDGELIEFESATPGEPSRLTRATRRKLILTSPDVQEVSEEVVLRGSVPEFDQDRMTFTLQVANGERLNAPATSQHAQAILEAFNGYRSGTRVALQGVARYTRYNRLHSVEAVEHISVLDPNDIAARLDDLRTLRSGWLNGKGVAPSPSGLDWLGRAFEAHYPEHLPLPYLYPTAEGEVRAEWSLHRFDVSLEVELDKRAAAWHALNLDDDREVARELDLDAASGWEWIVSQIQEMEVEQSP